MQKKELLYEGKAKKVYTTEDPEVYIVSYKDDATAFNGMKKGTIAGKGVVNNEMSNFMFRMLEEKGVPTHYVEELNERETAVKKVTIIPLEVTTPMMMPKDATARMIFMCAAFEPIAEFRKFTASFVTPTKSPETARIPRIPTMKV